MKKSIKILILVCTAYLAGSSISEPNFFAYTEKDVGGGVCRQRNECPVREPVFERSERVCPVREPVFERSERVCPVREPVFERPERVCPVREPVFERPERVCPVKEPAVERPERVCPVKEPAVERPERVCPVKTESDDIPLMLKDVNGGSGVCPKFDVVNPGPVKTESNDIPLMLKDVNGGSGVCPKFDVVNPGPVKTESNDIPFMLKDVNGGRGVCPSFDIVNPGPVKTESNDIPFMLKDVNGGRGVCPTLNIVNPGPVKTEPNGCGSENSIAKPELVPDNILGADFGSACNTHDRCYMKKGAEKTNCDKEFLKNLRKSCDIVPPRLCDYLLLSGNPDAPISHVICHTSDKILKFSSPRYALLSSVIPSPNENCHIFSAIYYMSVNLFGDESFKKAQEERERLETEAKRKENPKSCIKALETLVK